MVVENCHEIPRVSVAMPRCNDLSLVIEKQEGGQAAAGYVFFELSRLRATLLALDEDHIAKSVCYFPV